MLASVRIAGARGCARSPVRAVLADHRRWAWSRAMLGGTDVPHVPPERGTPREEADRVTDAALPPGAPTGVDPASIDPASIVRSRAYLSALLLAALLGVPISAVAYGFLALTGVLQTFLFGDLPSDLFGGGTPAWWPVP